MKKLLAILISVFFVGFAAAETIPMQNAFTGFEGKELSLEEANLIAGGETYIGYTHVAAGFYHTLVVITDKPIEDSSFIIDKTFESGAGGIGSLGSIGIGYNIRRFYNKPDIAQKKYNTGKLILQLVDRPSGLSVKDYDNKVKDIANSYLTSITNNRTRYSINKNSCNTTTSNIIRLSGGYVTPIQKVPGWKRW